MELLTVFGKPVPEEVIAYLPLFRDNWFKIGSNCEPADRPKAEEAIANIYKSAGKATPTFVWVGSPVEALQFIADKKYGGTLSEAKNEVWNALHGQTNAYWVAFYLFARDHLGISYRRNDEFEYWVQLTQSSGWWWPYENVCIICERPTEIHWEEDTPADQLPRLHNTTGPAITFRDGHKVYCIRGIRVEERIIMAPETITTEEIDKQPNQELRRIMVEIYDGYHGLGSYIIDSGAVLIHEDRYGKLYKKEMQGDEDMVMVRVEDATPLPDGSREIYWIRVPPTMETAHQAVAWTFGYEGDDVAKYNPIYET